MTTFNIHFSEQFLIEAFRRYRRTRKIAVLAVALKVFLAICLAALAILLITVAKTYFGAAVIIIFLILLPCSRYIDEYFIKRKFRKSPFWNDHIFIQLTPEGFSTQGTKGDTQLHWEAFTSAKKFSDGFLLFQGPSFYNWLPIKSLSEGSVEDAESIICKAIPDFTQA